MGTTNNKTVSMYKENVLATNKRAKEQSKSLYGAIATLNALSVEIALNEKWAQLVAIASDKKHTNNKLAYELIKKHTKANHKSGNYGVFYVLQGLNRVAITDINIAIQPIAVKVTEEKAPVKAKAKVKAPINEKLAEILAEIETNYNMGIITRSEKNKQVQHAKKESRELAVA